MGGYRKAPQRVGSLNEKKMNDKVKELDFTLRTIEEGRMGRNEMWDIAGGAASHCNPLTVVMNCYHELKSCGGGSDSIYVGTSCSSTADKGADGMYTCSNCFWITGCHTSAFAATCGGGANPYSSSTSLVSWGGGASVKEPEIITELSQHSRLIIGSCEVFFPEAGAEGKDIIVFQNYPNPFDKRTTIECYIPKTIQKAELHIRDIQGFIIKNFDIKDRGTISIQIHAKELPSAGTYVYVLTGDGKESNGIQMILKGEMEEIIVFQNHPNPFDTITTIACYIPEIIQKAEFHIHDMEGSIIKTLDITDRGTLSIQIKADELPSAGIYMCVLTGDNEKSNEIQMILK